MASKKQTLREYMKEKYGHLINLEDKNVIPTPLQLLNVQLGGGWEEGVSHLIAGYEGCGKSTLLAQSLGKGSSLGYQAYFVDREYAMNPGRLHELGCEIVEDVKDYKPGSVIHITGIETLEQLDEWLRDLAYKNIEGDGNPLFIGVDSIAAFPGAESVEAEASDKTPAVEARLVSKMFKSGVDVWKRANMTIIFTNQIRANIKINPYAKNIDALRIGQEVTLPGGNAPRFHAHQFVMLEPANQVISYTFKGQEIEIGKVVKATTIKNKIIRPQIKTKLTLMYKVGFNDVATLATLLKTSKVMKADGTKATVLEYGEMVERLVKGKKKEVFELHKFSPREFIKLWKEDKEFKTICMKHYLNVVDSILNPPLLEEEYRGIEIEEDLGEFEGYKFEGAEEEIGELPDDKADVA